MQEELKTELSEKEIKKLAVQLGWAEEEPEPEELPEIVVPEFDPMEGIKTLDDDPMAGIKTLDDDPMAGIKTLGDDPMNGIKTLDDDSPMAGIKTLDEEDDFDIFGDEDDSKIQHYEEEEIDPDAEEEITESEYRILVAAQKKQQKQAKAEEKLAKAEQRAELKAKKKIENIEKKKKQKEEKRQRKLDKENFGKLKKPHINPSIAVLLPLYNPERKLLVEQLRSIDAQTYDNISIIVLDDASEVLTKEDLMQVIPRVVENFEVRIERNDTHLGKAKTYETLIEMADADLVAFATQRDDWDRNKLMRLVAALEEDDRASFVYSDARVISENGQVLSSSLWGYGLNEEFKAGENTARALLCSNTVKLETALMKTHRLRKVVPFAPGLDIPHNIALRMAMEGKVIFVGRPLIDKRLHMSQDREVYGIGPKTDRTGYIEENISRKIDGLKWIEKEVELKKDMKDALEEAIIWLMARREYLRGKDEYQKELLEGKDFGEKQLKFEMKLAKMSDEMFETEYKKYLKSLEEPTQAYLAEVRKEERAEKFSKGIAELNSKISAVFGKKAKKKKGMRTVNTAVKREIERKMREEATEKQDAEIEAE